MNNSAKLKAIKNYRQHPDSLPGLPGIELIEKDDKVLSVSLEVKNQHLNPAHTSCHKATMVDIADTASGWGCVAHVPENAKTITTAGLSFNLPASVTSGAITCYAELSQEKL